MESRIYQNDTILNLFTKVWNEAEKVNTIAWKQSRGRQLDISVERRYHYKTSLTLIDFVINHN